MGQIIGRKPSKTEESDIGFSSRIKYDFTGAVLITGLDANVPVPCLWSEMKLSSCPAVVHKYIAYDRYLRNKCKAVVTFDDELVARNFVAAYHQAYLFGKLLRVYYLKDYVKHVFEMEMTLANTIFSAEKPFESFKASSMSITVLFTELEEHHEDFARRIFSKCGTIISVKRYRRSEDSFLLVRVKFASFAEAYAAFIAYDGNAVNDIAISIAMDKNPYYYIMYLEGNRLSTSISSAVSVKL